MVTLKNCPWVWVFMKFFSIPSSDGKMLKTKTSSSCPRPKLLRKGAFIWGTCVERSKTPSPCVFGQISITAHFGSLIHADISAESLSVGIAPHMQNHGCVREEGLWLLCSGWCTGSGSPCRPSISSPEFKFDLLVKFTDLSCLFIFLTSGCIMIFQSQSLYSWFLSLPKTYTFSGLQSLVFSLNLYQVSFLSENCVLYFYLIPTWLNLEQWL